MGLNMNNELREYLTGQIVDHGVTDIDQFGDWELSQVHHLLDFNMSDELINHDDMLALLSNTNPFYEDNSYSLLNKIKDITIKIMLDNIRDDFAELVTANKPVDNEYEQQHNTPSASTVAFNNRGLV